MRTRPLIRAAAVAVVVAATLGAARLPAIRHLKIVRSAPAEAATIRTPPRQLQLWFTEDPLLPLSRVTLSGPAGAVRLVDLRVGRERSLVVDVRAMLEPGAYKIVWRTAGEDGHAVQGEIAFTVSAGTPPGS